MTLIFNSLCLYGKELDLHLCQVYEFQGQLSEDLKEDPKIATHAESGLKIDVILKPTDAATMTLLSLAGKSVMATALVEKKTSQRQYVAKLLSIKLGKPPGIGAGTGNIKAKKSNIKTTETCEK